MIVEQGLITDRFEASSSIAEAIAGAGKAHASAWIAATNPSDDDLTSVAPALGLDAEELLLARKLRKAQRIERAFAVRRGEGVLDFLLLGFVRSAGGEFVRQGEMELLCGEHAVVVLATDWREPIAETRADIVRGLAGASKHASMELLERLIRRQFQQYGSLLDDLEDSIDDLREAVLTERESSQLTTILRLYGPAQSALVAVQPFFHGLDYLQEMSEDEALAPFTRRIRADAAYLALRIERIDKALLSVQQTYFSLAQDEANRIAIRQGETARRIAGWALLLAIPTMVFGLYGTNFENIPLISEDWGYALMLIVAVGLCILIYWRLRRAGWL